MVGMSSPRRSQARRTSTSLTGRTRAVDPPAGSWRHDDRRASWPGHRGAAAAAALKGAQGKGATGTYARPATMAEAGIVRIQAITILRATPQRTAESRSLAPTPMIALEITWVVETGIPNCEAPRMIVAAVVS